MGAIDRQSFTAAANFRDVLQEIVAYRFVLENIRVFGKLIFFAKKKTSKIKEEVETYPNASG